MDFCLLSRDHEIFHLQTYCASCLIRWCSGVYSTRIALCRFDFITTCVNGAMMAQRRQPSRKMGYIMQFMIDNSTSYKSVIAIEFDLRYLTRIPLVYK